MVDLPQPELADDAKGFALAHGEGDVVHRLHRGDLTPQQSAANREVFAQVVDQQQRLRRPAAIARISGHAHLFSLTSIALRNPSLIRLKHIEVMKIITPGSAAT